jgi:hypothetical protein
MRIALIGVHHKPCRMLHGDSVLMRARFQLKLVGNAVATRYDNLAVRYQATVMIAAINEMALTSKTRPRWDKGGGIRPSIMDPGNADTNVGAQATLLPCNGSEAERNVREGCPS